MAVKFDNGRIRLWKGCPKTGLVNIGIRFKKDCSEEEIQRVYDSVKSFLTSKYGEGIEGVNSKSRESRQ